MLIKMWAPSSLYLVRLKISGYIGEISDIGPARYYKLYQLWINGYFNDFLQILSKYCDISEIYRFFKYRISDWPDTISFTDYTGPIQ